MPVQQKYRKKAIAIGDSHLQWINTKLFNESLPIYRGSLKHFSGAKTLDLEHYMKPSLNKNWWPDTAVIHKGSNDIDFRNLRSETAIKDIAGNTINIALLCKEYGVGEVVVPLIIPKRNIKLSKVN